ETQVLTTFFAISAERLEPTGKTLLTFYETAPGYVKPAHEWFYPGRIIGYEFIYPKEKMTEITAHLLGAERATIQTTQAQPQTVPAETEQINSEQDTMAQNVQPEVQREPSDTGVTEPESTPVPQETTAPAETQTPNTNMPA